MRKCLIILFLSVSSVLSAQVILTIEGQTYVSTETGTWDGVQIAKTKQTLLTFSNNSITAVNSDGYFLLAGDEAPASTNNNLDGAVITGNKLIWNGTTDAGQHGIFVGYNKNDVVEYNYIDKVPYGVVFKADGISGVNMANTTGGFAYNIVRNSDIGVRIKGINGVCVYNNTFYDDIHSNVPGLVYITNNPDAGDGSPSINTKIKNNIFYSSYQIANIFLEAGCERGFESDYNVFYCESGTPVFIYQGTEKTFAQWRALGYDTHSIVVNPNFINTVDFIPSARLDYGTDLGATWQVGLSTSATWIVGLSPATANQNGIWQAGARVYDATSANPVYISSVIENATPNILEMTYSLSLANVVPAASAFNVRVNSVSRNVNLVAIVGGKVRLTIASPVVYGDIITVSYSKPANNPLQTETGVQAASITLQSVDNNCINVNPVVIITSPGNGSSFTAPANITITANASDADGTISKVEFYNGSTKLGEKATAPFSFTWNNVAVGTYSLTAVATDNFNAKTTSSAISVSVINGIPPVNNPPTVSIVSPVNGSSFTAPANITITANASDADGTISKVEFYNGSTKLGEKATTPFSFTWNNVAVGTYLLTAVASDNLNSKTSSAAISISVANGTPPLNIPPAVSIVSPSNGSAFISPASITIAVNASDADGTISKVEFYNGSTKLGEKASAPYSFNWNNVAAGTFLLTAVATDNLNAKTTSSVVSLSVTNGTTTVNKPPTVSIVSPVNGSSYTAPANIFITADAFDSDGTISKLAFFNGTLKLGEITTPPYLFTWTNVKSGTYLLTAIATDNLNATTTSSSIEVDINLSNEISTEFINLFPNPNQGYFTVEILSPLQNEEINKISIINLAGKKVYDNILQEKEITRQFELPYLESGIYVLMIIGKEIISTKKFIKN